MMFAKSEEEDGGPAGPPRSRRQPAGVGGTADPVAPSTAPVAGDWIALIQGYIRTAVWCWVRRSRCWLLWVVIWRSPSSTRRARARREWAEVGVLGIVGAVVLIFASYLLTGSGRRHLSRHGGPSRHPRRSAGMPNPRFRAARRANLVSS